MSLRGWCVSFIASVLFGACFNTLTAQQRIDSTVRNNVYSVNYKISLPAIAVGAAVGIIGQERSRAKDDISITTLSELDPDDVPRFDRLALRQDPDKAEEARKFSDVAITSFPLLPVLLFFDKDMRRDFLDISIVYAEAQIAVMNVYSWSFIGPEFIERFRPVTYYDDVSVEERMWGGNRNSFYSGHVSTVSTTTFYMAKSYLDYHPEFRHDWLLYSVASIPPAFFGYKRIQALKHFPSDILAGYVIGAAAGYFWPELHKKGNGTMNVSILYEPGIKCVYLSYRF